MTKAGALPSFEVHVGVLPSAGFPVKLRPDEAERPALAAACGVTRFMALEADLLVSRWRGEGFEIGGEIRADCEQPCVVTLAPVRQEIREKVALTFVPEDSSLAKLTVSGGREIVLDPEGPDAPETYSGDSIDLWPIIVECLVLAIDPFPRAPGASLDPRFQPLAQGQGDPNSPFAALAKLKKAGPKTP